MSTRAAAWIVASQLADLATFAACVSVLGISVEGNPTMRLAFAVGGLLGVAAFKTLAAIAGGAIGAWAWRYPEGRIAVALVTALGFFGAVTNVAAIVLRG